MQNLSMALKYSQKIAVSFQLLAIQTVFRENISS
jgi:hypothetical protein